MRRHGRIDGNAFKREAAITWVRLDVVSRFTFIPLKLTITNSMVDNNSGVGCQKSTIKLTNINDKVDNSIEGDTEMVKVRSRGEEIRRFIINKIEESPDAAVRATADHFKISRQAVNKHLQRLTKEGAIKESGKTRSRVYSLAAMSAWSREYEIDSKLAEDVVFYSDIVPVLGKQPDNVMKIWEFCFTEMFNNALDHSGGQKIFVHIVKTAVNTQILIADNGVGIFKKIQKALGLLDERHAILELSKGKLTTDPQNHTGQGIFFTSRLMDSFDIVSGGVSLNHEFGEEEDWIFQTAKDIPGTTILMKLNNHTARSCKRIFDQYSSDDDYGFNKTVVPVKLAQYGSESLVSRSQAKRILSRVELFKVVLLNFEGVPTIGQAFADEIFRVFKNRHPEIDIYPLKANTEVKRVIEAAKAVPAQGEIAPISTE